MLMDFASLVETYDLKLDGVLHLGAHLAEEAPLYAAHDTPVLWVEGNEKVLPKIHHVLRRYPKQSLVHALVWSEDDVEKAFNVTNHDGMSSSLLEFGTHPTFSPDTVFVDKVTMTTTTVDTIVEREGFRATGLVMDLQGCEGPALLGAKRLLPHLEWVLTEVNCEEVYQGCTRIEQLDQMLVGFRRVETYWVPGQGWGDAAYRRTIHA